MKTYSPSFSRYLCEEYHPAQEWAASPDGKAWIQQHSPSLAALMISREKEAIFGVYSVSINGKIFYIGESIRLVRRLIVHAFHLAKHKERFGVLVGGEQGEDMQVDFQILSEHIFKKEERLEEELFWIERLRPALQRQGSDRCIPRRAREAVAASVL